METNPTTKRPRADLIKVGGIVRRITDMSSEELKAAYSAVTNIRKK